MKRLTNFIVSKRIYILAVMLILTAVCSFLIPKVSVNSDMSKYLPDDSSMRQGLSLMEKEFPTEEKSYTIRVMFKGLSSEKKTEVKDALAAIEKATALVETRRKAVDEAADDAAKEKAEAALQTAKEDLATQESNRDALNVLIEKLIAAGTEAGYDLDAIEKAEETAVEEPPVVKRNFWQKLLHLFGLN